jgi:hypothetical protein
LHLTPDQKIQARAIHRQTAAAVKAISDNPALTPDQKLAQIRATRQRGHRQFRELLTDQQREKLYRLQKLIVRFRRLTQE